MRHLKKGRKFGRTRGQRKAFLNSLAVNLINQERITTTEARAKELRPFIERLVTYGKKQDVHGLRLIMKRIPKETSYKLFHEIAPRYTDRPGGYTRIIKHTERRKHDAAKKATIEFV